MTRAGGLLSDRPAASVAGPFAALGDLPGSRRARLVAAQRGAGRLAEPSIDDEIAVFVARWQASGGAARITYGMLAQE
jgi:hypothetical protein